MEAFDKKVKISIAGCGWYGFELAKTLIRLGYQVNGSTTSPEKLSVLEAEGIRPYLLRFQQEVHDVPLDFFHSDILIICIPPTRIAGETERYAGKIKDIARLAEINRIRKVLFISSTSVYADTNQIVDELTTPCPDTVSAQQILAAEQFLSNHQGFSTCILRFSGLVGPGRHPGRFFSGKTGIPNGQAPINLIHLDDCIGITLGILQQEAFGYTFNASAPHHPEKQAFYPAATAALSRPMPEFVDELAQWKIISSLQITQLLNYSFKIDNWLDWLRQGMK